MKARPSIGLLVPLSANDFTPFAQKINDAKPDLLFVAWAGASGVALFKSLEDCGRPRQHARSSTGLDQRAGFPLFANESKIQFLVAVCP